MIINQSNLHGLKASYKKNKFYDVVVPKITVSYADTGCTTWERPSAISSAR